MLRTRVLFFAYLILVASYSRLTLADEPLLLLGQETVEATLLAATSEGELQFEIEGKKHNIQLEKLVRWSTLRSNVDRSEIILTEGSRLVLADNWTGQPTWQMTDNVISATTKQFGKVNLQRSQVRVILLHAPKGLQQRFRFLVQQLDDTGKQDCVRLTNGDQWLGRVVRLGKNYEGQRQIHLQLDATSDPLQLPESRVAAIVFATHVTLPERQPKQKPKLVVGLHSGSLLMAESLVTDTKQLHVRLPGGLELNGTDRRDVAYLRSLTVPCFYLSDITAYDYQHKPYLEIPWPYRSDMNILGGPLQATGRLYSKGLGMPTTARLTYHLDSKQWNRFVASVAIDDIAARRGSVVFRVLLSRDNDWQEAYVSPIVRGGDPPVAVSVELGGAKQLALVTVFADRGDESDYADWLEARLE